MTFVGERATRADIEYSYRLILNRTPSEADIAHWENQNLSLSALRSIFLSSDEFLAKTSSDGDEGKLLRELEPILAKFPSKHNGHPTYQPIFGMPLNTTAFQRPTINRCQTILSALARMENRNLSVLDVGSNLGFITMYLADYVHDARGIEVDEDYVRGSQIIARAVGSRAEFEVGDFFSDFERYFGSFDALLLMSVLHYLVAGQSMEEAKLWLRRVVPNFDVVICELSSSRDYPYMPEDPLEILSELESVKIEILGTSEKAQRPLVAIWPLETQLTGESFPFSDRLHLAQGADYTAKVYFGADEVLKTINLRHQGGQSKFTREIRALKKLASFRNVPALQDWGIEPNFGWLRTSRIKGVPITKLFPWGGNSTLALASSDMRERIACQVVYGLRAMLSLGLHWNDIGLHNLLAVDGEPVYLVDFGEADTKPTFNPAAMFTWLLLDLHEGRLISYSVRPWTKTSGGSVPFFEPAQGQLSPVMDLICGVLVESEDLHSALELLARHEMVVAHRDKPIHLSSMGPNNSSMS